MTGKPPQLVGYCNICGGDVLDDGERNIHRYPKRMILVDEMIALKTACARLKTRLEKRPLWPPSMKPLYDELEGAVDNMQEALRKLRS